MTISSTRWKKWSLLIVLFCICKLAAQEKYVVITDSNDLKSITNKTFNINEIEVVSKLKDVNIKAGSTGLNIDVKKIKSLPKFAGVSDPYKALQYIGGVSQAGEANSGLYVRGGNNDQNLITLNGTVIHNPTHVLGMFSVFNSDIVGQMRFIKSAIPAEFGGRLSSVVDVNIINTIPEKIQLNGSIGLVSSQLSTQIPFSTKFSVYGSLRKSYISSVVLPTLRLLGADSMLTRNKYEFWDLNAGFNYKLNTKNKISVHFYSGKDEIQLGGYEKLGIEGNSTSWGNTAVGIQLTTVFNNQLSLNQQVNYSGFQFLSTSDWERSIAPTTVASKNENLCYKIDLFRLRGIHQFKFGSEVNYNYVLPNLINSDSLSQFGTGEIHNSFRSSQFTVYCRDEISWEKLQLNIGVRANLFAHLGPYTDYTESADIEYPANKIIKKYSSIEPRFFMRYLFNTSSSVKISLTKHYQYQNQIPVFSIGIPAELQIPASLFVKPQSSWHFSSGYFRNFFQNSWEFSVEAYYKSLENQLEFKNGIATTFNNGMFEKNLLVGKGWTYGTEWKISKNSGRLTGWITYNLAWNYRLFDNINNAMPFLARNDRRHNVSIIGMYAVNDRLSFSSVFVYATGNRFNLPLSWFIIDNKYILEYGRYNSFVMPAYHRLDVAANYKLNSWHGIDTELNFSVYNLYNRANPFQVYYSARLQKIRMYYLLPVIPSVSLTFKI